MSEVALTLTCSVEAEVTLAFAWQFRTDVTNWNDPPARFVLHGPFEAGSFGLPSCPRRARFAGESPKLCPAKSSVVEMPLEKAMLTSHWHLMICPDLEQDLPRKSYFPVKMQRRTSHRLKQVWDSISNLA